MTFSQKQLELAAKMKILITGGGGYVGSVLTGLLLSRGYKVRVMDNFFKGPCDGLIPYISNPDFEFIKGDVANFDDVEKAMRDVHGVVHLAAVVGFPKCAEYPELSMRYNVDGTRTVCSALQVENPEMPLVFASTGSVYGKVTDEICTEETKLNAQSLYGRTKIEGERIVRSLTDGVIYRFATGFGVGNTLRVSLLINDLVYQALSNRCMTIFQADAYRTFIHVRDMCDAIEFAISNFASMKNETYNVGGDSMNATKRELAEYIGKKTGAVVNYAEFAQDLDQRDYKVDYSKIAGAGWEPTVSIYEGIDELIKVHPLIRIKHQYE